jgi:hypothetical protein
MRTSDVLFIFLYKQFFAKFTGYIGMKVLKKLS